MNSFEDWMKKNTHIKIRRLQRRRNRRIDREKSRRLEKSFLLKEK